MSNTFKQGDRVRVDGVCEGTVATFAGVLKCYKIVFDDGRSEWAYEDQLEEVEE